MSTYYIGNHGWVTRYPAAELDTIRDLSNREDARALGCLLRRAYPPRERTEAVEALFQDRPTLAALESRYIAYLLNETGGNRSACARTLGIGRNTLLRKLKAP